MSLQGKRTVVYLDSSSFCLLYGYQKNAKQHYAVVSEMLIFISLNEIICQVCYLSELTIRKKIYGITVYTLQPIVIILKNMKRR